MSFKEREMELRLDILASLARGQRALAAMLEQVAAQMGESPEAARRLRAEAETLGRYQRALAVKISGVRIRHVVRGIPGKPWFPPTESRRK